jgi:hypothetical protein
MLQLLKLMLPTALHSAVKLRQIGFKLLLKMKLLVLKTESPIIFSKLQT